MIKNLEASIRARLQNISKENGLIFDYVLLRYMQEKILKRLSLSRFRENFILKGGLFFLLFNNLNPRTTKDIDFLGNGIDNSEIVIRTVFKDILMIEIEDGLKFDYENIDSEIIKEDADYEGIRLHIECNLGSMNKKIQIDIGYGDKIYPKVQYVMYPSLLDEELKNIAAYSIETVIAEKFEAMLKLSYINSRMKDFYDIYNIIKNYDIEGEDIKNAIVQTLRNRGTIVMKKPVIFNEDFYNSADKQMQWNRFIMKINVKELTFEIVIDKLQTFFDEIINSILEERELIKNWSHTKTEWK